MLGWSTVFLLVVLVAAVFGFTGIAVSLRGIGRVFFFLFLVIYVVSLFIGRRPPPNILRTG